MLVPTVRPSEQDTTIARAEFVPKSTPTVNMRNCKGVWHRYMPFCRNCLHSALRTRVSFLPLLQRAADFIQDFLRETGVNDVGPVYWQFSRTLINNAAAATQAFTQA